MMAPANLLNTDRKQLIGMVHLLPLPGAPEYGGSMAAVRDHALRDAAALADAGFDAIMIENFGDVPFAADQAAAETVAAIAIIADRIRQETTLPIGINVLRNDAAAALGIAAAAGAAFVRINVLTGAMLTDQGWITGKAYETVRLRQRLQLETLLCADVLVKHAVPLPGTELGEVAADTYYRAKADVLIVSGRSTGAGTDPERVALVKRTVPEAPVWIGSGLSADTARTLLAVADGAIVGSALKRDRDTRNPVDLQLAKPLVEQVRAI